MGNVLDSFKTACFQFLSCSHFPFLCNLYVFRIYLLFSLTRVVPWTTSKFETSFYIRLNYWTLSANGLGCGKAQAWTSLSVSLSLSLKHPNFLSLIFSLCLSAYSSVSPSLYLTPCGRVVCFGCVVKRAWLTTFNHCCCHIHHPPIISFSLFTSHAIVLSSCV